MSDELNSVAAQFRERYGEIGAPWESIVQAIAEAVLGNLREHLAALADKQADQRGDYLYRGQPDAWLLDAIRRIDAISTEQA
jgi:hypothetical protein